MDCSSVVIVRVLISVRFLVLIKIYQSINQIKYNKNCDIFIMYLPSHIPVNACSIDEATIEWQFCVREIAGYFGIGVWYCRSPEIQIVVYV